jgi:hypothetical protein
MRKRIPRKKWTTRKVISATQKYFQHALSHDVVYGMLKPGKKLVEYHKQNGKILINPDDVKHVQNHVTDEFFNSHVKVENFTKYEQRRAHS